jgi:DNA repair protein RadC
MPYVSIKDWAADDRPREKLLVKGTQSLSDAELLAILLGSGTHKISAVELKKVKGIGEAKAITIVAALELGRRRSQADTSDKHGITSSKDVFNYFQPLLSDLKHEEFWILYLNRSNKIIEKYRVSQGGVSGTVIDVKLVLKRAIELLASSIVACHNHPSGNRNPSDNDIAITEKLKQAALQMDMQLVDHIIIADNLYYSFCDEGIM